MGQQVCKSVDNSGKNTHSGQGAKSSEPPTLNTFPTMYQQHVLQKMTYPQLSELQMRMQKHAEREEIAVMIGAPDEALFLAWLVNLTGAKKVLEIGTFRGTTTMQLALAVKENDAEKGLVTTVDITKDYTISPDAEKGGFDASKYWKEAGVEKNIDFVVSGGLEYFEQVWNKATDGQFDLVFLDAHKSDYERYYEACVTKCVRKGGIIAVDNTLWHGRVLEGNDDGSEDTATIKRLNAKMVSDKRVQMVELGVADGLALCRVR